MDYEWKINGEEIHNPLVRVGVTILAIVAVVVTLPVTIPAHFVLKSRGMNGFFRDDGKKARIIFDRTSFQRF